jgi:hypothetical protein
VKLKLLLNFIQNIHFIWSEKILFISIEIQKEKRICVYLFQDFNEFCILLMWMEKKGPKFYQIFQIFIRRKLSAKWSTRFPEIFKLKFSPITLNLTFQIFLIFEIQYLNSRWNVEHSSSTHCSSIQKFLIKLFFLSFKKSSFKKETEKLF